MYFGKRPKIGNLTQIDFKLLLVSSYRFAQKLIARLFNALSNEITTFLSFYFLLSILPDLVNLEPFRLEGDIPNSVLQSIFVEVRARDGSRGRKWKASVVHPM